MNKLSVFVLLTILFSGSHYAQERIVGEKHISKRYEMGDLNKSVMLSKAANWFKDEERAETNNVETMDVEKGLLEVSGETKVLYRNIGKELYPKRSGMAEVLEARFGHLIEVSVNDGYYDISYKVTEMKEEMYKKQELFFDCVNFEQIDESKLKTYNKAMDKLLKANLVFKKRREIFADNTMAQFEEVSSFLLNEGEVYIFSLNEAITAD